MKPPGKRIFGLVPLLLFAVMATSVLTVLVTGAQLYGDLTGDHQTAYLERTAGQYIGTRVRQTADPRTVTVEELEGLPALVFREEINGSVYTTQVYCHEGYLRELFAAEDSGLGADAGERVLELQRMEAVLTDGLLELQLTDPQGITQTYLLDLTMPEGGDLR